MRGGKMNPILNYIMSTDYGEDHAQYNFAQSTG